MEVSRHNTLPTAMGRWPPLILQQAKREAPHRWGWTGSGARPAARRLIKLIRERLAWSGDGHSSTSRKWLDHKPDGLCAVQTFLVLHNYDTLMMHKLTAKCELLILLQF